MSPIQMVKAPEIETLAQRVQRLQGEAQALAAEHIAQLEIALAEAARIAAEIAAGGEAYHVGVRELAHRLGPSLNGERQTIELLMRRAKKR